MKYLILLAVCVLALQAVQLRIALQKPQVPLQDVVSTFDSVEALQAARPWHSELRPAGLAKMRVQYIDASPGKFPDIICFQFQRGMSCFDSMDITER